MDKKTEILPYFPLSVFLFPGEDIPLRIFEPRYRQLIEEVRETGESFVIPFVIGQEIQEQENGSARILHLPVLNLPVRKRNVDVLAHAYADRKSLVLRRKPRSSSHHVCLRWISSLC